MFVKPSRALVGLPSLVLEKPDRKSARYSSEYPSMTTSLFGFMA